MSGIIYILRFPNGKVYIGQTKKTKRRTGEAIDAKKRLELRFDAHCSEHSGCIVRHAIHKYGRENVQKEVLLELSVLDLNECERRFIALYQSDKHAFGYNRTKGGEGGGFTIPKVRKRMLKVGSKWHASQKTDHCKEIKLRKLNDAKSKDHTIEERRLKNAKAACQSKEYRDAHSKIQLRAQNTPATKKKRKETWKRKREELLASLPEDEREAKRKKLEAQAKADMRFYEKKRLAKQGSMQSLTRA